MILIDTDIFVIARRYPRDTNFQVNANFLEYLQQEEIDRATTIFNLFELCGILSFNLTKEQLRDLFVGFSAIYSLRILYPPFENKPAAAAFDSLLADTMRIIQEKVAFLDALILSTAESVPGLDAMITWNAKHFQGKTKLTVQTPISFLRSSGVNLPY